MKLLFLIALFALQLYPVAAFYQSRDSNYNISVSSAVSYTGPGDVYAFSTWYGMRAYSAATRGTRAINLCDDTGANCTDISTNATTGNLNAPGTLGSNNCNTSGTCRIKTWYDQTGNTNCASTACDVTQATNSGRATFLFSCQNSLPCGVFLGANTYASANSLTQTSPMTVSTVSQRTGAFTSFQFVIGDNFTAGGFGYSSTSGDASLYSGGDHTAPASNSATHSIIYYSTTVASGASITVDGSATTGLSAESGAWSGTVALGEYNGGAFQLVGHIMEAGVAGGNQTASNTTMCHNQYLYWAFGTSC